MPSSATITSFNSFSPNTTIRSSEVNANFSIFRGHIIPVDPTTSAAATSLTYDLGSSDHVWRSAYMKGLTVFADTTGSTPPSGFYNIYIKSTNGKAYKKDSSGSETELGSGAGGGSGANFVTTGDAESGVTGFNAYADAAGTSPVDGTGGSPNVTIATSPTSPLESSNSFVFTKDAANRQGQGFSYDFTIDSQYKSKILQISFYYLVNSGTFVAGSNTTSSDVTIWIYDVTNSRLIQPSAFKLFSTSTTVADKFEGSFQASADSTSYRLIFHVGSTSASAYSLKIDSIAVSPSVYIFGSPVLDKADYVPTLSNSTNATVTKSTVAYRGDTAIIEGYITWSGAGGGSTFTVSIPSGLTIDTNKINASAQNTNLGSGIWFDNGTARKGVSVLYSSTTVVQFEEITASAGALVGTGFASGDVLSYRFEVPITGLSSSVQMSGNGSSMRVVAGRMYRNSSQTIGPNASDIKISLDTASSTYGAETHGMINTSSGRMDIKVSSWYRIFGIVDVASTNTLNTQYAVRFYRNGVLVTKGQYIIPPAATAWRISATDEIYLTAGDYIEMYVFGNGNNSVNTLTVNGGENVTYMSITSISGPTTISSQEPVNAYYTTSGGNTVGTSATLITFSTKVFDSFNAYSTSTGLYTCPIPGKYLVIGVCISNSVNLSTSQAFTIQLFKNGSVYAFIGRERGSGLSDNHAASGSVIVECNAGDTIALYSFSGVATSLVSGYLQIDKIG